jgi:hypothetical protein
MGHWSRLAESNIYSASIDPGDACPKAEPQNKGVSYHIPLQAGYRRWRAAHTDLKVSFVSGAAMTKRFYDFEHK